MKNSADFLQIDLSEIKSRVFLNLISLGSRDISFENMLKRRRKSLHQLNLKKAFKKWYNREGITYPQQKNKSCQLELARTICTKSPRLVQKISKNIHRKTKSENVTGNSQEVKQAEVVVLGGGKKQLGELMHGLEVNGDVDIINGQRYKKDQTVHLHEHKIPKISKLQSLSQKPQKLKKSDILFTIPKSNPQNRRTREHRSVTENYGPKHEVKKNKKLVITDQQKRWKKDKGKNHELVTVGVHPLVKYVGVRVKNNSGVISVGQTKPKIPALPRKSNRSDIKKKNGVDYFSFSKYEIGSWEFHREESDINQIG